MAGYVRPVNVFEDFLRGREAAHTDRAMRNRNALTEIDIERERGLSTLMQNPQATPEQFARAGRSDISNAITSQREFDAGSRLQAVQRIGMVAQKALTLDPMSRKAFLQQAVQHYGPAFQALGADPQKGLAELAQLPDTELEQRLTQVAAFSGAEELTTQGGPFGSKIVRQGNRFQVVEPPRANAEAVNQQIITRPVGNGMVQDFAWNPRNNQRTPSGEPYKPVTPHTGNVTEGERKAAALGTRLEAALQSLNQLETTAPGASRPGLVERGLEAVGMETAANTVRSSDRQQADTAQLDALDAALTLATGAAYTQEQLKNLRKSYFPQIGDSDKTVKAKQKRFETIVQTARIAAGRAEPSIDRAVGAGAAPSAPTATGPNGEKVILQNGQWVPYGG